MPEPIDRARALIGTRFRPQGRTPETGFDCVGLALLSFDLKPLEPPRYRLTDGNWRSIDHALRALDFEPAPGPGANVLAVTWNMRCYHLSVLGNDSFVHADLSIGSVVETPGRPAGAEVRFYQLNRKD